MDEVERLRARVEALESIVADICGTLYKQSGHDMQIALLKLQETGMDGAFRLAPKATDGEEARHSAAIDFYGKLFSRLR